MLNICINFNLLEILILLVIFDSLSLTNFPNHNWSQEPTNPFLFMFPFFSRKYLLLLKYFSSLFFFQSKCYHEISGTPKYFHFFLKLLISLTWWPLHYIIEPWLLQVHDTSDVSPHAGDTPQRFLEHFVNSIIISNS